MAMYESPRALRQALRASGGDWNTVLTVEQQALPLVAEAHSGHATLGSWIADGAGVRDCAHVWAVLHAHRTH